MKTVAEMSDWHVGSRFGISHPDYISRAEARRSDCTILYNSLMEIRDQIGKIDVLILGGDIADGWNPKEHGDDRTATEDQQVEIATKLVRELKGSPTIYAVDGTCYHRGSRKLDELIADRVGAVEHHHYRSRAPPLWDFQVQDVNFNIAHPITISKSTWQYQSTPIAREEVLAILNQNPANIVLRFHAHYWVYVGYLHHFGAVCPGYQTKTPFQGRVSALGEYRIGSVIFNVNGSEWDWHEHIWSTEPEISKVK